MATGASLAVVGAGTGPFSLTPWRRRNGASQSPPTHGFIFSTSSFLSVKVPISRSKTSVLGDLTRHLDTVVDRRRHNVLRTGGRKKIQDFSVER